MNNCTRQIYCIIDNQNEILGIWSDIATIFIAIANLILAIYIFTRNNKKTSTEKEKDRKIHLLQTLVLDHNLNKFYSFFDDLEFELNKLTESTSDKAEILEITDNLFIKLSRKFTDTLLAVDKTLYEAILSCFDELQEKLYVSIGNEGINLKHPPKFDEEITQIITRSKTAIIQKLFHYRG